jgi:acetoin utilization deacetylase AcuC-like enzyme
MTRRLLLITDEFMLQHDPGPGHPERPARLQAILSELERLHRPGTEITKPRPATRQHIERVHDPRYIDRLDSLRGRSAQLDADTAVSPQSVDAAYLAAGAAIDAVTAIVKQPSTTAFAFVRPPGHHAERDRAMGFCLFNNIAIAAAHAIAELGCQRVLIVDWDVHHGNGTQHTFEDRNDVLFFRSHQWPLYPGTGALHEIGHGIGEGFTINAPLPAGFDDAAYIDLYRRLLTPIADQYKPDLVLVSAGFDAHRDDPLANMRMTETGFAALCSIVRDIADRHANGRLGLMLEGGYNLAALSSSVAGCLAALAADRESPTPEVPPPNDRARQVTDDIVSFHGERWPLAR